MNPTTAMMILKLLDLLVLGINLAPEIKRSFLENKSKIQKMIEEERNPTIDEWDTLISDIRRNTEELNS